MKNRIITVLSLLVLSAAVQAELKVDVSGDVQYRLRYNYLLERDSLDRDSSRTPDFQNRYAWNFRLKITPNEFVVFGFRLSNPNGYGLDGVGDDDIDGMTQDVDSAASDDSKGIARVLSLPEAYFKWSPGAIDLSAGIIPVHGNTVLDLASYNQDGYQNVGSSTWMTAKNESQTGLMFGVNYLNSDDYLIRSELMFAMVRDEDGSNAFDAFVRDKFRFLLNVPIELKKNSLSIIPTGHFILNNYRSENHEEASHTVEGGLELKMQPIEKLSILLGAAGGLYNNEALKSDTGSEYLASAPLGMLLRTKIRFIPSFGRVMAEFRYGRSRDREAEDVVNYDLFHWDIKYAMPVKKVTIMPRFRAWYTFNSNEKHSVVELRPALILKAAF